MKYRGELAPFFEKEINRYWKLYRALNEKAVYSTNLVIWHFVGLRFYKVPKVQLVCNSVMALLCRVTILQGSKENLCFSILSTLHCSISLFQISHNFFSEIFPEFFLGQKINIVIPSSQFQHHRRSEKFSLTSAYLHFLL